MNPIKPESSDSIALQDIKSEGFSNVNKKILINTKIFDSIDEDNEIINDLLDRYLEG